MILLTNWLLYNIVNKCFWLFVYVLLKGGEESTIDYMESQSVVDPKVPLLNEAYAYGVVEHPFPLNFLIRKWHLGSDFYNAVKIGIVQYVCAKFPAGISL